MNEKLTEIEFRARSVKLDPEALVAIGGVYQAAFAGEPWYEVSRCAAPERKLEVCPGGLSPLEIGAFCTACGLCPMAEAYPSEELTTSLSDTLADPTAQLYLEREGTELLLAAIFWEATPKEIADRKYKDVPEMENWLSGKLPDEPVVWMDEIFANKRKRATGNLWNYRAMIEKGIANASSGIVAFRTINQGLLKKTKTEFPAISTIVPGTDLPDTRNRNFIIIDAR